jgi:transcriptional regulator with XRE-family HTH domain
MKNPKIETARKMICQYMSELAKEKGLSTYKIAELTGFKQQNVSRMLQGRYSPTLDNLIRLAESLDCYIFVIDKNKEDDLVDLMKNRWGSINEN